MSKKINIQQLNQSGVNYGKISSPTELMNSQQFTHEHIEAITKDFLTATGEIDVAGFEASTAAMVISLSAGRIYQNGLQFDGDAIQFNLVAANATHPRVDVIYATVTADSPSATVATAFQRLRTESELNTGQAPYPIVQFPVSLEKKNIVSVAIKTGTPSATPVMPVLASNEIALWRINVGANVTSITGPNLIDLRHQAVNLRNLQSVVNSILGMLGTVQTDVATALQYQLIELNWAAVFGENRTQSLVALLSEMNQQLLVLRFRYPTIVSGDGRISASAQLDGSTPVIDVPLGQLVQFGDRFITLQQANFAGLTNVQSITSAGSNFEHPALIGTSAKTANLANTVRFDAPSSTKWLVINRDGEISWKSEAHPSNAYECLLLKAIPNGVSEHKLKMYYNLRNGVISKTGVADSTAASKQFPYDSGYPTGIGNLRAYGVRAADKTHYELDALSITNFDEIISVSGVTIGDTWVVEEFFLSNL
jgi:hypothetical protein